MTAEILDDSMNAMGIKPNMVTDVDTLKEILSEMGLDDFKTTYLPMTNFFEESNARPQALKPMIDNIRQGIISKHPAIVEFLKKGLNEGWLKESPDIVKSVHVTFVLEAITAAMCNSNLFFIEIVEHVRAKERALGIDSDHLLKTIWNTWPAAIHFFATAKALSLDPAMAYFRLSREFGGGTVSKEAVEKLYNQGGMSYLEYKLLMPVCAKNKCISSDWLRINIYEAGITEYKNNFKSNAISAHALSEETNKHCHQQIFKNAHVFPEGDVSDFYASLDSTDNYFPTFSFHGDWVSLYETWNMAFILGELNNLHYLFPKLIIPSVINAKAENFLGARIIALWLSINTTLFLNFRGAEAVTGPSNRNEMAQAWGEINRKYAYALSNNHLQEDSKVLSDSFSKRFSRPFYNLGKLIFHFIF